MVCIECGANDDRFNYLCQDCYLKSHPIKESNPRLKIAICKFCTSPSIKPDVWYEFGSDSYIDLKNVINKAITDLVDIRYKIRPLQNKKINIIEVDQLISSFKLEQDILECDISIEGIPEVLLPEIHIEEHVKLFIKYRKCK